jgi:hypothetical protein
MARPATPPMLPTPARPNGRLRSDHSRRPSVAAAAAATAPTAAVCMWRKCAARVAQGACRTGMRARSKSSAVTFSYSARVTASGAAAWSEGGS